MDNDEIIYLHKLLKAHTDRMRNLEVKKALYGINCPSEIESEIGTIHTTIDTIRTTLGTHSTPDLLTPVPTKTVSHRLLKNSLSIVYLMLGLVCGMVGLLCFQAVTQRPTMLIISPEQEEKVSYKSTIYGFADDIPTDRTPWLYIYALSTKEYFFHPILIKDHAWMLKEMPIGSSETEKDTAYKLGVLLASSEGNSSINRQPFNVTQLPKGTEIVTEITVTR